MSFSSDVTPAGGHESSLKLRFTELGLRAEILRAIAEEGYTEPTPIQAKAIPVVLAGRDLMAAAQTGTGKTAGFTLPILQLLSTKPAAARGKPRVLVPTPTRELALQVTAAVEKYSKFMPRVRCVNPDAALRRQRVVLDLMADAGYLPRDQIATVSGETTRLINSDTFSRRCTQGIGIKAPHFVVYVRQLLEEQYGPEVVYKGGLRVTTTIDLKLQKIAEDEARKQIAALAGKNVTNASVVALNPKTGEILAMLGSVDFFDKAIDGQVNVAVRLRQPGSSIKPINYLASFEKGYSPATVIPDVKTVFQIPGQPDYIPENYDLREHGLTNVRTALASSFNIPAVKTLKFVTVPGMIAMAKRVGSTTFKDASNYGLSLTLGGGEIQLLELTGVLSTTPEPMLTPTLTNAKATRNEQSSVIIVAAGVIGLVSCGLPGFEKIAEK